jgi:hypothetical protein
MFHLCGLDADAASSQAFIGGWLAATAFAEGIAISLSESRQRVGRLPLQRL